MAENIYERRLWIVESRVVTRLYSYVVADTMEGAIKGYNSAEATEDGHVVAGDDVVGFYPLSAVEVDDERTGILHEWSNESCPSGDNEECVELDTWLEVVRIRRCGEQFPTLGEDGYDYSGCK